jgi:hypothetical protein
MERLMKRRLVLLPFAALALSAQLDPSPVPLEIEAWIDASQLEFGPEEGRRTTHYELAVTERGRTGTCRVTQSSGDRQFDASLCKQLRKNARFERTQPGMFRDVQRFYRGYFYADPPGPAG